MSRTVGWKGWRWIRRSAPIAVIAVAVLMFVLDLTGRLTPNTFERLLVLAVGLLAVDALVDKIDILEKIEEAVYDILAPLPSITSHVSQIDEIAKIATQLGNRPVLRNRSTMNAELEFVGAREIDIIAITGVNLLLDRRALFEKLLGDGLVLRVLLLSPTSNAWAAWNDAVVNEDSEAHLKTSIGLLRGLLQIRSGGCTIRYAPHLLPCR